jgi:hypothetical protein
MPWNHFSSVAMNPDARPNVLLGGVDSLTSTLATTGFGFGGGHGAFLDFALGETWFTPEGYLQLPTVSLTSPLSADTNMEAGGSTGLYFDYKTSGDVEYVDLRVRTNQIHAENTYAVAYVKVKGTGGQWKGAQVKWTDFILPNWGPAFREAETQMSFSNLVSLEWSVSSAKKEAKGSLAVDNVFLLGLNALPASIHSGRAGGGRRPGGPMSRGAWLRRGSVEWKGMRIGPDGRRR